MNAREAKEKKNTYLVIILVAILVLFVGAGILIANSMFEKATYKPGNSEDITTTSLFCTNKTNGVQEPFFDFSSAESVEQIIKVIFKNNKINDMSYSAKAHYKDGDLAKRSAAGLEAKYSLYMQDNGAKMADFSPNFSVSETNVMISLFANISQLNSSLAKVFLLDVGDGKFDNYSPKTLSTSYNSKGFSCQITD